MEGSMWNKRQNNKKAAWIIDSNWVTEIALSKTMWKKESINKTGGKRVSEWVVLSYFR